MTADDTPYIVRLEPRLRERLLLRLFVYHLVGWVSCVALGLMVAMGIVSLIRMRVWQLPLSEWGSFAAATAFIAFMSFVGYGIARATGNGSRMRKAVEADTVLTLTGATLEFPELPGIVGAESWPLSEVRMHSSLGRLRAMVFTSPGRRSRPIPQSAVDVHLAEIEQRITQARRRQMEAQAAAAKHGPRDDVG